MAYFQRCLSAARESVPRRKSGRGSMFQPFWRPGSGQYGKTLGTVNRQTLDSIQELVLTHLGHLREKHGEELAIQVVYEDQERNDFNSLFSLLSDETSYLSKYRNVYPMATNIEFLKQCVPDGTCDVIYSSNATHLLKNPASKFKDAVFHFSPFVTDDELRHFRREAAIQWEKFLVLRARELKPGGLLVVISNIAHEDYRDLVLNSDVREGLSDVTKKTPIPLFSFLMDVERVWKDLRDSNSITEEEFTNLSSLVTFPTPREITAPFEEVTSPVRDAGLSLVYHDQQYIPDLFKAAFDTKSKQGVVEDTAAFADSMVTIGRVTFAGLIHDNLSDMRSDEEKTAIVEKYFDTVRQRLLHVDPECYNNDEIYSRLYIPRARPKQNRKVLKPRPASLFTVTCKINVGDKTRAVSYRPGASGAPCSNVLPGLYKQSRGVDVTKLDLMPLDSLHMDDGYKSPVIELTCSKGKTRTSGGVKYELPDQVWVVSDESSGSLTHGAEVMKTSSEARKVFSVDAGVDVQTKKFGFSASISYSKAQSTLLKNERKVEFVSHAVSSWRVDLQHKDMLSLGESAQRVMNGLPAQYTANPKAYEEFVRQFGTHYVASGKSGGVMMMMLETRNDYFEYYGGVVRELESKGLSAWQPTIMTRPWLFPISLRRISSLVRDATKRASLDQAISDHVMRVYLTVELRRVLQTLPSEMRWRGEVTSLNNKINSMSALYPLNEGHVESLGNEVMRTYTKLFLEYDNARTPLTRANKIMGPVNFECPAGKSITEVQSWHSDWHDDRTWAFRCSYLPNLYTLGNCYWTGDLYNLKRGDQDWTFSCRGNSVIKGWKSQHHDWWDTRLHQLKCCQVLDAPRSFQCSMTGWKNPIMGDMKVVATASQKVIRGLKGHHSDWHE
ncbi:hypothetical protein BaRGS_00004270 [Batillaria attramentaria]|uniref:MACPF domain-containing protein n=1 Tax=Batillaria attramentaria TaxID=370345 RepID=A0ABD0LY75_9CAEN